MNILFRTLTFLFKDIYLFGTRITGLLLIGLGFALGYRKIQKTGTAVQSLTRLPAMTEAVGAVSIETETINRNIDSIMEKLTALQRKIDDRDQNGQRVAVLECGYSPKQIAILSFGSPATSTPGKVVVGNLYLGKNTAVRRSCSLPHSTDIDYKLLHTHTQTYALTSPPPSLASVAWNPPPWQVGLWPAPRMAAGPDGCLLELDYFPVAIVVSMVYVLFVAEVFFSCSHTVLPKEHSLFVFFLLLSFMLHCNFLQFPFFLSCLPHRRSLGGAGGALPPQIRANRFCQIYNTKYFHIVSFYCIIVF